jgi:hypothetical protein
MSWSEPERTRVAVRHWGRHIGYVTIVDYAGRDFELFPEGSPYFEVAVSDLNEKHVALFQRFKQHWLIHCGNNYDTADGNGALTPRQITRLATLALQNATENGEALLARLKREVERVLG